MRFVLVSIATLWVASLGSASTAAAQAAPDAFDEVDEATSPRAGATAATRAAPAEKPKKAAPRAKAASTPPPPPSTKRTHNTLLGPVGGLHIVDAGSAAKGSFRLQLASQFFFAKGWLQPGDDNDSFAAALSLSWTPLHFLEVFGAVKARAHANDQGDPQLLQTLGDSTLGIKLFHAVLPWLTLGGDASMALLNQVGGLGPSWRSTSGGFRANASADLQRLPRAVPLILRLNLQYWFDNSRNLVRDTEDARYAGLADPAPRDEETRHLVTRIERFALSIQRNDFFYLGYGFEVPLKAGKRWAIHPLLEWQWGIPVNRQNYLCPYVDTGTTGKKDGTDGCLDRQGLKAYPMTLSAGARFLPPVDGLGFFLAAEVGLTGSRTFVRELAPTAPYQVMLGLSYAYDGKPQSRKAKPPAVVAAAPPFRAAIAGSVVDKTTQAPVVGAAIRFPGRALTSQLSDEQGRFLSYELPPGQVNLLVEHPQYEQGSCSVEIPPAPPPNFSPAAGAAPPSGQPWRATLQCVLAPLPKVGAVEGMLVDEADKPVANATVLITGTTDQQVASDATGAFKVLQIVPGDYQARVQNDEYLSQVDRFAVAAQQTVQLRLKLLRRPKRALVTLSKDSIRIRQSIRFANASAQILPQSDALMAEIADTLLRHAELLKVEVQGHTDDKGSPATNLDLSQRRAESVRNWLVDHGVESSRLVSKGYGETQPLAPNLTAANRQRNRRVQFVIVERRAAQP